MAPNVESFASLRVPGWHNLGTVFQNEVTTEEMLEIAELNGWNVRVVPISLPGRSDLNPYAVVRDNPKDGKADVLGIVKSRYVPFQNEQLFDFGDYLLRDGRWETAGSLAGGTKVFGSLALDREVVIDAEGVGDKVNTYLLVSSSHDGTLAIQATVTPVRVVCQNTLSMALKGAKRSFKIRHTDKAEERIEQASAALGLAANYTERFAEDATALFQKSITDVQWSNLVKRLYPEPDNDSKAATTKWTAKVDLLDSIYNGPTNEGIRGTAWGAYNALTERLDWYRKSRTGEEENIFAARSGFDVAVNTEKDRILAAVRLVGAK